MPCGTPRIRQFSRSPIVINNLASTYVPQSKTLLPKQSSVKIGAMSSNRVSLVALAVLLATPLSAGPIATLRSSFQNPPDDARIMMRWWWFGPGVNKAELEKEMRMMKAGGIGGFEVQPVYP